MRRHALRAPGVAMLVALGTGAACRLGTPSTSVVSTTSVPTASAQTVTALAASSAASSVAPGASPSAGGRGRSAASKGPVEDLHLDRLGVGVKELGPADRNPFRFKVRAAPVAGTGGPPPGPVMLGPPVPPPVLPPPPPPPPPIQVKFIGVIDSKTPGGRVAVLNDAKGNVFYGREGDIIDGRFRLLKIGVESAELAYVDGRGRQTFRLSGQ